MTFVLNINTDAECRGCKSKRGTVNDTGLCLSCIAKRMKKRKSRKQNYANNIT